MGVKEYVPRKKINSDMRVENNLPVHFQWSSRPSCSTNRSVIQEDMAILTWEKKGNISFEKRNFSCFRSCVNWRIRLTPSNFMDFQIIKIDRFHSRFVYFNRGCCVKTEWSSSKSYISIKVYTRSFRLHIIDSDYCVEVVCSDAFFQTRIQTMLRVIHHMQWDWKTEMILQ